MKSTDEASHARRLTEEPFRLVADVAPVLMWVSDLEHGCTYASKPWADFTGRTQDALLGTGWRDSIHPDDLPRHLETLMAALTRREPFKIESRIRRHDGVYRWMLASGMPQVAADGSLSGWRVRRRNLRAIFPMAFDCPVAKAQRGRPRCWCRWSIGRRA